ncbi:uncharacterized protein LTR77_003893 [Saxophila tyrrhenica]|uniref:Glycosyl transferase CAP10 domain-containing protein n=1 Tax=Saxophila tyrrhenica TaxID=1690608 RepID=A0AAV9PFN0_9PEZI|nr:hypothetical protein LTR77_003893 [Saxophila tyrrhenica]
MLAFTVYFHISTSEHRSFSNERTSNRAVLFTESIPGWFYLIFVVFFLFRGIIWASSSGNNVGYHPIDMLIYDAQSQYDAYLRDAAAGTTLDQAVENYRKRYSRYPPPGFDHWYRYATERDTVIIDSYDSIHRDLVPFWSLSPEEVRYRTKQLLQNPWHNATGISVRDGKAATSTRVVDDHWSTMSSLVDMISAFSEWLPDMDLAFNINNEGRIAVPWETQARKPQKAEAAGEVSAPRPQFSTNRAAQWEPLPNYNTEEQKMQDLGWQSIFHSHGSAHCPPGSPAREQRNWDRGSLCSSCAAPHSMGLFPANWTELSDVCHQPDLAELHGFYNSPSAFRTSYELLPLFSQSKAPGFDDIL